MNRIDFVFFDAGGGHRSAATALLAAAERQGRKWEVRLVNLQEVLDEIDIARRVTGYRLQDVYNTLLRKGWTLGSAQMLRVMQAGIRAYHDEEVDCLATYWARSAPELVVSLIPHFNRAIFQGLRKSGSQAPLVTIITDIADYPPHFWIEKQEQFLICGSEKAVEQARAAGFTDDRRIQTSGMIIHPRFYDTLPIDRRAERVRLGLDPDKTTGIVIFGGSGSTAMLEIALRLDKSNCDFQLIFICGRNEKLRSILAARRFHYPYIATGFTTNVPYYMRLSDFLIGKPGPGCISEGVALGLPVIVERNAWTLPQERYNATWIEERQIGLVLPSFRRVRTAVEQMLETTIYHRFKQNVASIKNRAVFEIPEILQQILEKGSLPPVNNQSSEAVKKSVP